MTDDAPPAGDHPGHKAIPDTRIARSEREDEERRAVAQRIRAARGAAGLSQQEVADHLGMPRSAFSDVERARRRIDALELRDFARRAGTRVYVMLVDDAEDTALDLAMLWAGLGDLDRAAVERFAGWLSFRSQRVTSA